MTEKMKTTLFVQNARPSLQETLNFIDNQVIVENMTKVPTKKADTVNNVIEDPEKQTKIRCWDCNGEHRRQDCTADKKSLYCRRCKISGHSYDACRRRRRPTRSPSQSGWSTRSPSASSPPHHPANLKPTRKRERRERSEKRKDDLERRRNPNITRGTNALPLRTLPQAAVGPTVGHVARQEGHPSQEERIVIQ